MPRNIQQRPRAPTIMVPLSVHILQYNTSYYNSSQRTGDRGSKIIPQQVGESLRKKIAMCSGVLCRLDYGKGEPVKVCIKKCDKAERRGVRSSLIRRHDEMVLYGIVVILVCMKNGKENSPLIKSINGIPNWLSSHLWIKRILMYGIFVFIAFVFTHIFDHFNLFYTESDSAKYLLSRYRKIK